MNDGTSSSKTVIPSFRLTPKARRHMNQIRLHTDLVGVTLVRLFLPFLQNPIAHNLLSIYNIAAWVTILTVDNTRIPEAGTTRIQQRKSWRFGTRWIPVLIAMLVALIFGFHQRIFPSGLSVGKSAFMTIGSYFDEMLFRNTVQPKLRQLGLSQSLAIGTQSILYALAVWLGDASLPVVFSFLVLGCINGWMVYRFRSLWAAFMLGLIWNVLWFA